MSHARLTGERSGDIPATGKPYVTAASNARVTADQTAGLPDRVGSGIRDLVDEYERRETIEAKLAHDADKLELVIQSREYQTQGGYDTSDWLLNSVNSLKTPIARHVAALVRKVPPDQWWRAFREVEKRHSPES